MNLDELMEKVKEYKIIRGRSRVPQILRLRDLVSVATAEGWHTAFHYWWVWVTGDLRTARRWPRWWFQRAKQGWSDRDAWSLFSHQAGLIADVCQVYLDNGHGFACLGHGECGSCTCNEDWDEILRDMVKGFRLIAADDSMGLVDGKYQERPECVRALDLYREHFYNLWD